MAGSRVGVMIVDDHDMVRNGLAILLEAFEDLDLVGTVANGAEAIQLCNEVEANVALIGLTTPKLSSIATIRAIRQRHPQVQIVALISFGDEELLEEVMKAGAAGYAFKNAPIDYIAKTIRAAARDGSADRALTPGGIPHGPHNHGSSGNRSPNHVPPLRKSVG